MHDRVFYAAEHSKALDYAVKELASHGLKIAYTPGPEVTHLLLGVPCRLPEPELAQLPEQLPKKLHVFGGFLDREVLAPYFCHDLLKDEPYLAQNARITAHCALRVAEEQLSVIWEGCPVLITGGGRIAQCLGHLLKALGADVVLVVRRPEQRALLSALGFETEAPGFPEYILGRFRVIFNTVPALMLPAQALRHCRPECLKIELASVSGLEGDDIIIARGLPGIWAPETSGRLIARTILRLCTKKEAAL